MRVATLARRCLARMRPSPPAVGVYAFGKHPAFADFVDVGRLPPVPAAVRHFHDALRPAVERDGGPAVPVWIAWHDRGVAAVVRVQPSRDRGDAITGRFRRCPLLLGASSRSPLPDLLRFAGGRLAALAETVMAADGEAMLTAITAAAAGEWPDGDAAGWGDVAVDGTPVVAVAGPGGVVVESVRLADTSPTVLGEWVGRAAGPLPGGVEWAVG